jgi:protein-L-isoaspartate O-methyltransferase
MMAARQRKPLAASADASVPTREVFEKELTTLAAKAPEDTTTRSSTRALGKLFQAAQILAAAAVYANVSLLNLSPVYGSIPASINHQRLVIAGCMLGWTASLLMKRVLPRNPAYYLAPLAFNIPLIQHLLFLASDRMGPYYGPAITEMLTLVPLLAMSAAAVTDLLEDVDPSMLPKPIAEAIPGTGSFLFFRLVETISGPYIRANIDGSNLLFTRVGAQALLGGIFARLAPSTLLLYGLPGLLFTAILNPHTQTSFGLSNANESLSDVGFRVLARQDSVTGYVSVIESVKDGFRALRCDHSLLGGIWLHQNGLRGLPESIYGIFATLEAVRLVETDRPTSAEAESALVIGLGIGITPSALSLHGINTTTVEIDPAVRDYAQEYFSYPANQQVIIADAITHTASLVAQNAPKYDYIVHDVFTGGAEPVPLFTAEFLGTLRDLLKPEGVIAINYAGDLLLPSARIVVKTISSLFPTCRIFREYAAPEATVQDVEQQDFTNMVIFCTQNPDKALTFRDAVEADFLGSGARQEFLVPKHEIDMAVFEEKEGDGGVLTRDSMERLARWQTRSAVGHWRLMRTVIPARVWEMW